MAKPKREKYKSMSHQFVCLQLNVHKEENLSLKNFKQQTTVHCLPSKLTLCFQQHSCDKIYGLIVRLNTCKSLLLEHAQTQTFRSVLKALGQFATIICFQTLFIHMLFANKT